MSNEKMSALTKDKKALLSNFFSLSVLQGLNMILPLITLPYLVRVLGIENFGLLNFSLSIIMILNILVSFGFELSATREISMVDKNNIKKISLIFSAVMTAKIALAVICSLALFMLVIFVDRLQDHYILYFMTFGIVIGNVLFPSWFFQGMERMKYITYINVITRIIFTVLIFVLVKEQSDYIYVPILNSLGMIFGGLYSLWLVKKLFKVELYRPSMQTVLSQLKNSYHYFLSRVANQGSRHYATAIIGVCFGNVIVGYYSIVEKLFYAFISVGGVVAQTIFPYMSRTRNIIFFKKILFIITLISVILLIPIFYFHSELLQVIFDIQNEMISKIFVIVFSGVLFGIVSSLLGYPLLAAFGYVNHANNSLIYASILYFIYINIIVIFFRDMLLVSFSLPLYMIIALVFRLYYVNKEKLSFV